MVARGEQQPTNTVLVLLHLTLHLIRSNLSVSGLGLIVIFHATDEEMPLQV